MATTSAGLTVLVTVHIIIRYGYNVSWINGAAWSPFILSIRYGYNVSCVCYSNMLSSRDHDDFAEMFASFGVVDKVTSRRRDVHCAGIGVPALRMTALEPYPRNGHAVGALRRSF